MENREFKNKLKQRAKKININLNEEQLERFLLYKELLLSWNEKINLTAIKEDEDFITKHFIDSLTVVKYIKENHIFSFLYLCCFE